MYSRPRTRSLRPPAPTDRRATGMRRQRQFAQIDVFSPTPLSWQPGGRDPRRRGSRRHRHAAGCCRSRPLPPVAAGTSRRSTSVRSSMRSASITTKCSPPVGGQRARLGRRTARDGARGTGTAAGSVADPCRDGRRDRRLPSRRRARIRAAHVRTGAVPGCYRVSQGRRLDRAGDVTITADPDGTPRCSAVASLHAISTQSLHDLGRSPFISALALDFARAGRLITSSHSLSGFGSCWATGGGRGLGLGC
jgi:hypothetical protein